MGILAYYPNSLIGTIFRLWVSCLTNNGLVPLVNLTLITVKNCMIIYLFIASKELPKVGYTSLRLSVLVEGEGIL